VPPSASAREPGRRGERPPSAGGGADRRNERADRRVHPGVALPVAQACHCLRTLRDHICERHVSNIRPSHDQFSGCARIRQGSSLRSARWRGFGLDGVLDAAPVMAGCAMAGRIWPALFDDTALSKVFATTDREWWLIDAPIAVPKRPRTMV